MENVKELLPHQQRVVEERMELMNKITKLHEFFKTPVFAALDETDKDLLEIQSDCMMEYADILLNRINRF